MLVITRQVNYLPSRKTRVLKSCSSASLDRNYWDKTYSVLLSGSAMTCHPKVHTQLFFVLFLNCIPSSFFIPISHCPRGLTFTWWGCCGLRLWHKPTELPTLFFLSFCSCVCFCLYGPFNCISFHEFSQQLSAFSLFFRSFFCLIGPFNCISL